MHEDKIGLEAIIDKLRNDENYYGDFGKKYLSNSDISTCLLYTSDAADE